MRTIIIGDIRGCNEVLKTLHEKARPGENDGLVLLGDLFDQGRNYGRFSKSSRRLMKALALLTYWDKFQG